MESTYEIQPEEFEILIVEDSPTQAGRLRRLIQSKSYRVRVASNGQLALGLIAQYRPDLVLSDIIMPEMNGYEATQHIRKKMEAPKSTIPIIALTADVTKEEMDKCTALGMDDYILKPFNETDLLTKIIRLVKETKRQ